MLAHRSLLPAARPLVRHRLYGRTALPAGDGGAAASALEKNSARSPVWRSGRARCSVSPPGRGCCCKATALQSTPASVSAFLTQFYAIMIPVYLAVRLRRWPPGRVLLCGGLVPWPGWRCWGGLIFAPCASAAGEAETLLGSVFFMMQILLLGTEEDAANRALPVTPGHVCGGSGALCRAGARHRPRTGRAPRAVDRRCPGWDLRCCSPCSARWARSRS